MRKGRRERIEKGSHCFFKSSGYDKLELKHKNLVFFKLIECIVKKKFLGGQRIIRRERRDGGEGEGMVEREKRED